MLHSSVVRCVSLEFSKAGGCPPGKNYGHACGCANAGLMPLLSPRASRPARRGARDGKGPALTESQPFAAMLGAGSWPTYQGIKAQVAPPKSLDPQNAGERRSCSHKGERIGRGSRERPANLSRPIGLGLRDAFGTHLPDSSVDDPAINCRAPGYNMEQPPASAARCVFQKFA